VPENDTPSITEIAHDRDSDGELLPVTETVEIHGSEYSVDVYPPTTGEQNEWLDRLDDAGEEIADETVSDLLDGFAVHDPEDFDADSWDDVRPAIVNTLADVILAKLFDAEDPDAFAEELEAAAQEMQGNPD